MWAARNHPDTMNNQTTSDPSTKEAESSAGSDDCFSRLEDLPAEGAKQTFFKQLYLNVLLAADLLLSRIERIVRIEGDHLERSLEQSEPERGKQLWTVGEVADYLGVSKRTVETLIAEGELRPIRVRSLRRFEPSEIRDYCQRKGE
jgi:excisionase family DNA binding protein